MNEKRYKDTDLREALHRKYADTPQLPADFMNNMERKMNPPMIRRWWWVAAAASFLLIIGIGLTMMPTEETAPTATKVVAKMEPQQSPVVVTSQEEPKEEVASVQQPVSKKTVKKQAKPEKYTPTAVSAIHPEDIHYASAEQTKDTLPYLNPARVDEFIAKMAAYNNVKQGELECTQPAGSNVVSSVYVFPDNKEIDVFGRLLQVACCYSDETPGYLLSFSHQQFFFELKDMREQLQYRWIAERVNGKILLYGTHAPLGTKESSACYQEYRDELMHIKSINKNPREI